MAAHQMPMPLPVDEPGSDSDVAVPTRSAGRWLSRRTALLAVGVAAAAAVATVALRPSGQVHKALRETAVVERDDVSNAKDLKKSTSRKTIPKSVYFLLVDRFGRTDGKDEKCENDNDWCGGTIRGITAKLDYIKHMGFDAIWITPVIKQYDGPKTPSGTGCMGYWAYDYYEIDPHFGTKDDMKELVQELHKREMSIVYDFVANHMGPIHNEDMVKQMKPFNKPEYFNQLFRGNMSFNKYVAKDTAWPPPAQAMWSQSGAQCTQGEDCTCWTCDEQAEPDLGILGETADDSGCKGQMVFKKSSPCPKGALSKYCMPGDYACVGYNETITQKGWFYDLGDLNQDHPFVKEKQLEWIKSFVKEYDIDYLRLDTAAFMTFDFLSDLQEAAGASIMGEVTTTNMTYHAQFQSNPPGSGEPVLDGVLNFPLYYSAIAGFCGHWWPYSTWNLTFLGERMTEQAKAPYQSLERLGNFIDNHDMDRVTKFCKQDKNRIKNSLAWTMLAQGTPIVYYGTELFFEGTRTSFWQTGYDETEEGFHFIRALNEARREVSDDAEQVILPTKDHGTLVFKRGDEMVVMLNNLGDGKAADFCDAPMPYVKEGHEWIDMLTGKAPKKNSDGCFTGGEPIVLVQRPAGAAAKTA